MFGPIKKEKRFKDPIKMGDQWPQWSSMISRKVAIYFVCLRCLFAVHSYNYVCSEFCGLLPNNLQIKYDWSFCFSCLLYWFAKKKENQTKKLIIVSFLSFLMFVKLLLENFKPFREHDTHIVINHDNKKNNMNSSPSAKVSSRE